MSLSTFVRLPDVRDKLKPFRPARARKISRPLLVPPQSGNFMQVGSAFDYVLRRELHRRAPHAIAEWTAEESMQVSYPSPRIPWRLGETPWRLDEIPWQLGEEDVADLNALLSIVPWPELVHPEVVLLHPRFGKGSMLMDGAMGDLISGGLLVEVKVTNRSEVDGAHFDQLLGYFILSRFQCATDPLAPRIDRLGLYFARHGFLLSRPASDWTGHPDFLALEQWFLERALLGLDAMRAGDRAGD